MAENTAAASQASPAPAGTHASTTTTTTAATPVASRASAATRQRILDVSTYTINQLVPAWKYQEKRFRRQEVTYNDLIAQIGDGPLTNTMRGNLQAHSKILEHVSQQCDVIYEKHKELLKDAYHADLTAPEYIEAHTKLDEGYQDLMDDVDNIRDVITELLSRDTVPTPQKPPQVVATTQSIVTTAGFASIVTTAAITTTTASNTTTTTTSTGTRPKTTASQNTSLLSHSLLQHRSNSPPRTTGRGLGFGYHSRPILGGSRYGASHQPDHVSPHHSPGHGGYGVFVDDTDAGDGFAAMGHADTGFSGYSDGHNRHHGSGIHGAGADAYTTTTHSYQQPKSSPSISYPQTHFQMPKLPPQPTPTFSGALGDWTSYWDQFQALVGTNPALSPAQKMGFLKASLSGEPHELLKSLKITNENYSTATKMLCERYDDSRIALREHLDAILHAPSATSSVFTLRRLVNVFVERSFALRGLGMDRGGMWMLHLLLTKLDPESRRLWEKKYIEETATGNWRTATTAEEFEVELDRLLAFLKGLLQALERAHRLAGHTTYTDPQPKPGKPPKRQVGAVATQPGKKAQQRCPQCNQEHLLHRCDQFLALKTKERWANVKKWNICFNCFFGTHRVSECTSKFSCKTCKKKHHSLLHYENKTANALGLYDSDSGDEESDHVGGAATIIAPTDPTVAVTTDAHIASLPMLGKTGTTTAETAAHKADSPTHGESVIPTNPDTQVDFQALPARASGVYMSTILIPIKKPDGTTVSIRAMLDTGAECNVLSAEAANRINASIQPTTTRIFGVGGANGPSVLGKTSLDVQAGPDDATFTVNAFVMQNVVRALPRNPLPRDLLQQFSQYKLADPHFSTATTIDMLIGIENYHDFVCQKRVKVANMWLQETILGWTVSGKPFKRSPTPGVKAFTCFLTTYARESDVLLPSQLHDSACADLRQFGRFWAQEDPPQTTKPHLTTEEIDCQTHFDDTTTRQADGRVGCLVVW